MKFMTAVWSDTGIRKKINQDSVLLEIADTDFGEILFAAVCDGMGGLSMGEIASAAMVSALSEWFEYRFPSVLGEGITAEKIRSEWKKLLLSANQRIAEYGVLKNAQLGTTVAALLIVDGSFYIMNVGDSRIYRIESMITQMTRDDTFVQKEIQEGRMTEAEARCHPGRNVLLQCVGASKDVSPQFLSGKCESDIVFLICSDGFRNVITQEEMFAYLQPHAMCSEEVMKQAVIELTELNKERLERDNITAMLIRTCQEVENAAGGNGD